MSSQSSSCLTPVLSIPGVSVAQSLHGLGSPKQAPNGEERHSWHSKERKPTLLYTRGTSLAFVSQNLGLQWPDSEEDKDLSLFTRSFSIPTVSLTPVIQGSFACQILKGSAIIYTPDVADSSRTVQLQEVIPCLHVGLFKGI